MGIIKLNPAYKDYLWGGTKLKENFGKKTDLDIVAESWELSVHPDGPSIVANGEYEGKTFPEYLDAAGKGVLGTKGNAFENFPILIKFIDAKGPLSIQVHPDNEYALRVEHEFGKTEMWYIMDCDPGSFLYFGVNRVISKEERNVEFLKSIVKKIVGAVDNTQKKVHQAFPQLKNELATEVFFITTQELEDLYPDKTPKQREDIIAKEKGVVFIMQIGDLLESGIKHDGRAPDYDDWKLNGDLLFWNETLQKAFEVSSMGIRVDSDSLAYQLKAADAEDRMKYDYHKGIADGTLPLTIGGGIGQSRMSMLLLEKVHIGEVQVSLWPEKMVEKCKENGIHLL